ncbi:MAG: hypothetical protein EHM58_14935 [Ignavibacteriae bacterium]|nr:MAG: hypothetical protein EHM58_14935 [Ignavibacteriota bacterium]
MKTIIITIILLINICISQTRITEVKFTVNPNDNKQTVLDTIIYVYDKNNLVETQYNKNEPVTNVQYYYSSNNLLSEEKHYRYTIFVCSYKYEYDKSGKLIKEKCYDNNNKLIFTNSLKYDKKNNLISKISNIPTRFRTDNTFDSDNKHIKTIISSNTKNQKEIEYLYDEKGKLSQETSYSSLKKSKSGKRYQISKVKFSYDDNGKLTQKQNYLTDVITETFEYKYDDKGRMSKWEKLNSQGKVEFLVIYNYEGD